MHALIIGYGSIGARHARLLASMGHEVTGLPDRSGGSGTD
jgi:Trk K+ transport system NAD-binding subunit